ncbi:MAG: hypothetical protein Ct9H300mP28_34910 [Pseudomonadota bacterium]|nr:MAG: hypothetical protein Ct9H300mP28_34910 [Pseudomonadota bacterium]
MKPLGTSPDPAVDNAEFPVGLMKILASGLPITVNAPLSKSTTFHSWEAPYSSNSTLLYFCYTLTGES